MSPQFGVVALCGCLGSSRMTLSIDWGMTREGFTLKVAKTVKKAGQFVL
jgi:hypothetical protein